MKFPYLHFWFGFLGLMLFQGLIVSVYGLSESEKNQMYYDAESYFTQGNFTQAMHLYDNILQVDPTFSDAIAGKGAIFHRMGDFSTAIEYYDKAIVLNSTNPYFLSDKGNALLAIGLGDEAEYHLLEALDILPTHIDALNGIANVYSYQKNYEKELVYRTSAVIVEPDNQEALVGMGNSYAGLKDYDNATLYYDKALNHNPQNIDAIIGKGNVFLKIKDYDSALLQYDKALFIDSVNINALQGKSQVYVDLGENEMAAGIHRQIEIIKNTDLQKIDKIKNDMSIAETKKIPDWIRIVLKWFSDDLISEDEVIMGLEYLIKNGIMKID
ncbi:MAG: tetratricopeptide repeat protein [Nitrosopumilus sp.]|nr:tetratricopeptide repeat protein [Nitrosopumilus sp.]